MKKNSQNILSYGVLQQQETNTDIEITVEQISRLGFAVIDAGYSDEELRTISKETDRVRERYIADFGRDRLKKLGEYYTVRMPFKYSEKLLLKLALNPKVLSIVSFLIGGQFILNQQNLITSPPDKVHGQHLWHRDLPYQHFISSKPLAINALYCIDDFRRENGATFVLPATQKSEAFPSREYILNNEVQIEAHAGAFIVFDSMLYHRCGFNSTLISRKAINHLYTVPYFKQQINISSNLERSNLSSEEMNIMGGQYVEPLSVEEFLIKRSEKIDS